jgi:hypothetical protein
MPAIININGWDHWVLVAAIGLYNNKLDFLKCYDPFPVQARTHTYVDACTVASGGNQYGEPWIVGPGVLGNLDLEMSNVKPPGTLKKYAGKFVGIFHGSKPRASTLTPFKKRIEKGAKKSDLQITAPALLDVLRDRALRWEVRELQQLLALPSEPHLRLVHDIDGTPQSYALLSLFNDSLKYGVVAAFEGRSGTLMHFELVDDPKLDASLRQFASEKLFYTRRPIETLGSPYYPFRLLSAVGNVWTYLRLYDSAQLESTTPPAASV